MKHDTSQMIKREEHLPVILIGEGLLVGMIGGLIVHCLPHCIEVCREVDG